MAEGLQEGVASLALAEPTSALAGSDGGAVLTGLPETEADAVSAPPSVYDRVTYSRPSAELPPLLERAGPGRGKRVAGLVGALVVVAAVLALIFCPTTNDKYLRDLKSAGLLVQFPSHDAAIKAGKDFCATLQAGAPAAGTPADRIAVQHYCPVYQAGFTVTRAGQPVVMHPKKVSSPAHEAS